MFATQATSYRVQKMVAGKKWLQAKNGCRRKTVAGEMVAGEKRSQGKWLHAKNGCSQKMADIYDILNLELGARH